MFEKLETIFLFSLGKAGDYCYSACTQRHTCTAIYQQPSTYSYHPGYNVPASPPYSPQPYPVSFPGSVQTVITTTDPYPSTCPMSCSQHPTLDCYMQCNDECCEKRKGKKKLRPNRLRAAKYIHENFGRLDHPINKVTNNGAPANSLDNFNDKTDDKDENAESVIDNLETNIKNLGVFFDEEHAKHLSSQHNQRDTAENTKHTSNLTETSDLTKTTAGGMGFDENHVIRYIHKTKNSHDMIDDDQEPNNSDEEPANNSITTKHTSKHYEDENEEYERLENDRFRNNEETIPLSQEAIGMQEEEKAMDDRNEDYDEKSDIGPEIEVDNSETISGDDDSEEDNDGPEDDLNQDQDPPRSLEKYSVDPLDELLDEEGIDDVGKFGRKRDKVLHERKNIKQELTEF